MSEAVLFIFDVFYVDGNNVSFVTFRAEDEAHSLEKFRNSYPTHQVTQIEYRGEA